MSTSEKYQPGEFGYWWTVTKGNEDIEGMDYPSVIDASNVVLVSLFGAPRSTGGNFWCTNNNLTSLKHCPQKVSGSFWCFNNQLTSLEHCPESVGGDFLCFKNILTSLEHAPRKIEGSFDCHSNKLANLNNGPAYVGGSFYCSNNELTDLTHAPHKVGAKFACENNGISDPLSEIIDNNIVAQSYKITRENRLTFGEVEAEKQRRANIKRQLGPFAITVPGSKI